MLISVISREKWPFNGVIGKQRLYLIFIQGKKLSLHTGMSPPFTNLFEVEVMLVPRKIPVMTIVKSSKVHVKKYLAHGGSYFSG